MCRRRFLLRDEGRGLSRDCSTQCRPNCHASCDRGAGCRGAPGACSRSGLLGCARERDVLERLVAGVRAGQSRVLVLRGEAGVGKTSLLRHLSAAAEGCRIVRAAGVESEMELAFAGLHALCAPMLGRLAHLPSPQRVEHGVRPERRPPPDRFLVGLAVLSLVGMGRRALRLQAGVDAAIGLFGAGSCLCALSRRPGS